MKFKLECRKLMENLQFVTSVIERKFTYPILTNVLVEAHEDGTLNFRATDHDMSLVATIDALEVIEPGTITVPGKKFLDVIGSVDGANDAVFSIGEKGAEVSIGRSEFQLATMPAQEFPEEPLVSDEVQFSIPSKDFIHLLRAASSSMGVNDLRQYFNGALLEATSSHIRTVATDGMCMCICTNKDTKISGDSVVHALIPRKAVQEISKAYQGEDGDLEIHIGSNVLRVVGQERSVTTNLIEIPFPPYMRVVPSASNTVLKCDRGSLVAAINQALTLADEQQKIFFAIEGEMLKVTANSEAGDHAEIEVPVDFDSEPLNIIFRHDRLHSMLNTFDAEEVEFHIRDASESVRVEAQQNDDLLFVVSPIRG